MWVFLCLMPGPSGKVAKIELRRCLGVNNWHLKRRPWTLLFNEFGFL